MEPTKPPSSTDRQKASCGQAGATARLADALTAGQRALLAAELTRRQHELERRLALHHGGLTRAEHATEVLRQDGDDAPQRNAERSVDLALSDLETLELRAVLAALQRVQAADYGRCADCGEAIAFDRLKVEPWALRCVACEARHEGKRPAPARL
jgi:DnaK suppressor protein